MTRDIRLAVRGQPKRTRRGPHTRKQILDASLRLFSEKGFARTTVRDIAQQAGITDAAIYYHFESKRELLDALVEERGFLNSLRSLEELSADPPLIETLRWTARGAINLMDDNRDFLRLIIIEGLAGDEAALEQYDRLLSLWERALTTVLQRYRDKGALQVELPDVLARHIVYAVLMPFEDSLRGRHVPASASAADRRAALCSFVEAALDQIANGLSISRGD